MAPTAAIVGGGNLVGALGAGGEVFELVGFFSDLADGEIEHRPSTEESGGFAVAGLAVWAEAFGFAFSAVDGDDVAHGRYPDSVSARRFTGSDLVGSPVSASAHSIVSHWRGPGS